MAVWKTVLNAAGVSNVATCRPATPKILPLVLAVLGLRKAVDSSVMVWSTLLNCGSS